MVSRWAMGFWLLAWGCQSLTLIRRKYLDSLKFREETSCISCSGKNFDSTLLRIREPHDLNGIKNASLPDGSGAMKSPEYHGVGVTYEEEKAKVLDGPQICDFLLKR